MAEAVESGVRDDCVYSSPGEMPRALIDCFSHAAEVAGCPEARFEWFANLQKHVFSEPSLVAYVAATDGAHSVAALPLRVERQGVATWLCSLSNYYTSLYEPPLLGTRAEELVANCLGRALRHFGTSDAMRFAPMDPEGRAFQALLQGLRARAWVPFAFYCFGNWYEPVNCSWSEYLGSREGALRSTIKRKGRKFEATGGRLEIVTAVDNIDRAIDAYRIVYARSWKKPEPFPEFVPGLVRWLAAKGELRMGIAWVGERPIAAQIWMVTGAKASIFKLAYDEECAELAAGTLLTAVLMEQVIDRDRVSEVDYLIGDDAYKRSWMSKRRERWGIVAYNPRTLAGLGLLFRELAGRATRVPRAVVRRWAANWRLRFVAAKRSERHRS